MHQAEDLLNSWKQANFCAKACLKTIKNRRSFLAKFSFRNVLMVMEHVWATIHYLVSFSNKLDHSLRTRPIASFHRKFILELLRFSTKN